MLATILKEWRRLSRDRWLCIGLAMLTLGTIAAVEAGRHRRNTLAMRLREKQEKSRESWLSQASDTGHGATHHGLVLCKVLSPLFSFDPGVDPVLGTTVRLESHNPAPMTDALLAGRSPALNFDVSSGALLLQLVLPLFAILLSYSAVSTERELGTLSLVLSSGISWRRWVGSKMVFAVLVMACVTLAPFVLLFGMALGSWPASEVSRFDLACRTALLWFAILAYLAGWSFFSLGVSARVGSSRMALIVLLASWAAWSIVVPRSAVELARWTAPLPLQDDLDRDRRDLKQHGDNGNAIYDKLKAEVDRKLLDQYGVGSTKELPLIVGGAYRMATEEMTDGMYDRQVDEVAGLMAAQDRVLDFAGWISPYLAMRSLSAALAGTDRGHHDAFYRDAETHRRLLVRKMDEFDTYNVKKARPGPEVWATLPAFEYEFPRLSSASGDVSAPLVVLGSWLAATAYWATRRP